MGDISADHSLTAIPTMTGAAISESTHCAPHPATTAPHGTLWPVGTPIATHTMTPPTSIVTLHPLLTTSPADVTHATIPQARAALTAATPTTLHRNHSQEKPSHLLDLQPP